MTLYYVDSHPPTGQYHVNHISLLYKCSQTLKSEICNLLDGAEKPRSVWGVDAERPVWWPSDLPFASPTAKDESELNIMLA